MTITRSRPMSGLALALALLGGCADLSAPQKSTAASLTDNVTPVTPRPKVSSLALDEAHFRIFGLRVGLQDFMSSQSPTVVVNLPESADYAEILRCKHDTVIRGAFADLLDVDLGSPSTADATRIFKANNFWDAAAQNTNSCFLVSAGHSDKSFLDTFALSGSYRYVARACVNMERLEKDGATNRNCSRQVALSPALMDFKNARVEAERAALGLAQQWTDKVNGLGRHIHYLTVDFNNSLARCDKWETDRQVRLKKREGIQTLLGFGLAVGKNLLTAGGIATSGTFGSRVTALWNQRDAVASEGAKITTSLNGLFASPYDYPRTCTEATRLQRELVARTQELKSAHQYWANAMDDADKARASRTGMER